MNFKKILLATLIIASTNATFAQDDQDDTHNITINIPEVALLDLEVAEGSTAITLAGTAPTEAGLPMTFEDSKAKNDNIWINYSSIISGKSSRNVSVSITDGTVPTGLKLTVLASGDAAAGAGTMGKSSSKITLSNTKDQDIITGVGSAYTGDGANKGHKLTYQLGYATDAATNYGDLDFSDSNALTITYTLSDL